MKFDTHRGIWESNKYLYTEIEDRTKIQKFTEIMQSILLIIDTLLYHKIEHQKLIFIDSSSEFIQIFKDDYMSVTVEIIKVGEDKLFAISVFISIPNYDIEKSSIDVLFGEVL